MNKNRIYYIVTILFFSSIYYAQVMELPVYKNVDEPIENRISDLLNRMTLEEKVDLVSGAGFSTKKNIRLGIPELLMTDGPQGPNANGRSTHYGAMINLAATFNTDLMYEAANNMGKETRIFGRNMLLAPMINIIRTPFGGRSYECYSEDPFLTARMGVSAVKGIQDAGVVSSTKVLTANNQEWNRMVADVRVSERALREIYLPAAKAAVQEADTWSIMTAYNKINGIYAGENKHLIQDILKDEWRFSGFTVSDWGGTHSTVESANAGLDLEMPTGKFFDKKLVDAVKNGKVKESILDDKVSRILRVIFKAGLFDESPASYGGHSNTPERRALALKTARQSIVLLKNTRLPGQKNNFLPLNRDEIKSIAVIGPNGDVARMTGAGSGSLKGNYEISPYKGITNKVGENISLIFEKGIPDRAVNAPVVGPEYFTTIDGQPGIYAEYYNNKEQEGDPVYTTIEKDLNFNWGWGSPKEGVVNLDKWSAKFTGKLKSPGEGWYEIGFRVDNGVRLYIDGEKVLDA
ncbi:beta-glucosidase, partial [hydrothermal vent metagenome]